MLRQVSLSIENPVNPFRDLALKHNCKITIVDCKDFNSHGIALVLEIDGNSKHAEEESLLKELKEMDGVRHAYWGGNTGNSGILAMVIMDTPVYCSIARDSNVVCSSCPFNSTDCSQCNWKLLVSDANALRRSLDMLKNLGIKAETKELSNARYEDMLTLRQREVLEAAVKTGYFEFPRGISLHELAEKLSIKPSTLSEILRRAEDKITKYFAENPSSVILSEIHIQKKEN
jgi:predicted DNA binding protein